MLAAAPQSPEYEGEAELLQHLNGTQFSFEAMQERWAAPLQMPSVDTVGVMLELESRVPFVESQTTRRAMEAAVQLLRILAAHGVK